MTNIETSEWSGEGTFTQTLIDAMTSIDDVGLLRVEDAPSTRVDVGYQFISNEIYVGFRTSSPPTSGTNGEEDSIFSPSITVKNAFISKVNKYP